MKLLLTIICVTILLACNNKSTPDSNKEISENTITEHPAVYSHHILAADGDTLPYRLMLPAKYDKTKKYPLVLFLHGAGERGRDNELQLVHCASHFQLDSVREEYPAIVVFPQCQKDSTWNTAKYEWTNKGINMTYYPKANPNTYQKLLNKLLTELETNYALDKKRYYIGGLSMGGIGTFEFVKNNPHTFAAAVPICGGAHPDIASQLTGPAWWIFHGEEDDVIPVSNSQNIYDAMKKTEAEVKLTLYPEVKHDSWNNAIKEPELLSWMFSKTL